MQSIFFINLASLTPGQIILNILYWGGWIPFAVVLLWGAKELWLFYINEQWGSQQQFTLLAIDIPRGNNESLRSVENLFTYLAGAHGTLNLIDRYWIGKYQLNFSFEIVSIDGYTQFLIYTPVTFRNLVESAVYSVYPDAEISEVNDYTDDVPKKFPDNEYDMWGAEFIQVAPDVYPIKTYPSFEDPSSPPETTFKDPLASLMDLNSSLHPGEQLWFQIIVYPTGFEWIKKSDAEIAKILKEKTSTKKNILDHLIDIFLSSLSEIGSIFGMALTGETEAKKDDKDDSLKMMNLKPKEKKQVEAITEKASKLGFECKIRMIYIAKKEIMNKPKVINGFVGYIKQFIDWDLNNFKPDMSGTATSVSYLFTKSRLRHKQNNLMQGYRGRSGHIGRLLKILNIEELATLWHFPIEAVVRAPLIQKAPGRKSEPPTSLPFEDNFVPETLASMNEELSSNIFQEEILTDRDKQTENNEPVNNDRVSKTKKSLPEFFDEEPVNNKETTNQRNNIPGNIPFV